jgi:surfeit locus 1 family protein
MDFMRRKIGESSWWAWLMLALLAMAGTASLGRWQLHRAQQKLDLQHAIEEQLGAPVLTEQDLEVTPALWGEIHRRVSLQGYWMHQHTLFLDNRIDQGRAGFWVMTPLMLDEKLAVLVQRGWVPVDVKDMAAVPKLSQPKESVRVQGRLIPPPSKWLDLQRPEATPESGVSQIRHNIDITQLRQLWGYSIVAVVLQTDPSDAEMKREWSMPASTVSTHQGYAFQWFAMCAAVFVIALWFLIIQPLRHGST